MEVKHQYIQIERKPETWDNSFKEELIASDKPFDCLPLLETEDGKRYFCSGPILRFLAKKLGKYKKKYFGDQTYYMATKTSTAIFLFRECII